MIQLLALDLDDTLLREDLSISPRNKAAVRAAEERGVHVVLASGRAVAAMERYAEQLGMFERSGYMISDNGSTVTSTMPRATLVRHVLERPLLRKLLAAFEELELPVQVYRDKTILVTRENAITGTDMRLSGFSRELMADMADSLDFDPTKLVIPGDPAHLPQALQQIRQRFEGRVNSFISKPYFLEVLPVQADKGTALEYVATAVGVPREAIMAMGDAANDLGMIRFAGWGVAMANATDEVKKGARVVSAATHEHDGVAEIIERYLLSGPDNPKG